VAGGTPSSALKHGAGRLAVETPGSSVSGWPVEALSEDQEPEHPAMDRVVEAGAFLLNIRMKPPEANGRQG